MHFLFAQGTGIKEAELEREEGAALAQQSLDVMRLYGVQGPSEKVAAWLSLAAVLGKTYSTRIAAWKLRTHAERLAALNRTGKEIIAEATAPQPGTVIMGGGEPIPFSDPHGAKLQ